jgi:uncharacterized Zn-binding protein involved in type VI secretion
MANAARVTDPSTHGGVVTGPGVPTVLIGGLPAAVMGDLHACSQPHPPTPFSLGSATVQIGGRPALRMGDVCGCGAAAVLGAPTVQIGG